MKTATKLIREQSPPSPHGEHGEALHLTSSFRFPSAGGGSGRVCASGGGLCLFALFQPHGGCFQPPGGGDGGRGIRAFRLQRHGRDFGAVHGLSARGRADCLLGACVRGDGAVVDELLSQIRRGDGLCFQRELGRMARRAGRVRRTWFWRKRRPTRCWRFWTCRRWRRCRIRRARFLRWTTAFAPGRQRPLEWGADIVAHSGTKYLDGQGRILCGALAGKKELLMERVYPFCAAGPAPSPFNAWVAAKGMETLPLRFPAHCERALRLAEFLRGKKRVGRVLCAGLPEHPGL